MMDELRVDTGWLAPLGRDVDPNLAAVIGFVFGGVGLAIYFRSFVDAILPFLLFLTTTVLVNAAAEGGWGMLLGAAFAAMYGYRRAVKSNTDRGKLRAKAQFQNAAQQ